MKETLTEFVTSGQHLTVWPRRYSQLGVDGGYYLMGSGVVVDMVGVRVIWREKVNTQILVRVTLYFDGVSVSESVSPGFWLVCLIGFSRCLLGC